MSSQKRRPPDRSRTTGFYAEDLNRSYNRHCKSCSPLPGPFFRRETGPRDLVPSRLRVAAQRVRLAKGQPDLWVPKYSPQLRLGKCQKQATPAREQNRANCHEEAMRCRQEREKRRRKLATGTLQSAAPLRF